MQPRRPFLALLALAASLAACGGSSSETPWPMRPATEDLVPRGEELLGAKASDVTRPVATDESPDEYDADADAGAPPPEDPELE